MKIVSKAMQYLIVALETQLQLWAKQEAKNRLTEEALRELPRDRQAVQTILEICASLAAKKLNTYELKLSLDQVRFAKMALETQTRVWERLAEGGGLDQSEVKNLPEDLRILEGLIALFDRSISDGLEVPVAPLENQEN